MYSYFWSKERSSSVDRTLDWGRRVASSSLIAGEIYKQDTLSAA